MSRADDIFSRFPAYIQEFIYSKGWTELREVQLAAADCLFGTQNNLLLCSSTASGKTEAVFFPILTMLEEDPPQSISVLYISPIKSLINDQYDRMDYLLEQSGIPVTHWHGDVAQSQKSKLLQNPLGILQITPESLESMLMNRSNDIPRLFHDLRFVILDEIHTLVGTDRGSQILCQLHRVGHLIGHTPRRIGLSATVGDPVEVGNWLAGGSDLPTDIPTLTPGEIHWRLGMEHFFIQDQNMSQTGQHNIPDGKDGKATFDAGFEYMYDCVKGEKALVFSNSREETEYLTATFRQIARHRNDRDVFLIHHGNLSASLREEAEEKMKTSDLPTVTCATVTMELGIDIGKLRRILQYDSPNSVSAFLQRLGRSGRRGDPPEMMMVFREEEPLPNAPLPQLIPWGLIRAIAVVQLYIEERFIEPPSFKKMPMSLLFHQTLSILASGGEQTPAALAGKVLSLPPFANVSKEDYRTLLVSMVNAGWLEMTDEGGLIVGMEGEKIINSFKFYAVFKDSEDFTVRSKSDEIGTITNPPPPGDRFALAGRVWEVEEVEVSRRLIYVHEVEGKMEVSWPGDYGEIHTMILERMKKVLEEDTVYPYLQENAASRLEAARILAKNTGLCDQYLLSLGGMTACLFPWLGTRSFRTLVRYLKKNANALGISNISYDSCNYIMFRTERENKQSLLYEIAEDLANSPLVAEDLLYSGETPITDKFDAYIPSELLRRAYAVDRLNPQEVMSRMKQIKEEL